MRNRKLLLLLCLPALLPAGCGTDDEENEKPDTPAGQNGDIVFNIGFAPTTRVDTGADFTSAWEDGDAIGVFAVAHDTNLSATATMNYINNVKLTYNSADGGAWTQETLLYWPTIADNIPALDFYAYYPYDDAATDPTAIAFNVLTDQSGTTDDKSSYNLSDLLTAKADNSGGGYGKGETVDLTFSHALAMIQVSVPSDGIGFGPGPDLTVTLRGVKAKATLDLMDSEVSLALTDNNAAGITMCRLEQPGDNNYETSYTYRALVPAQEIAKGNSLFFFDHEGRQLLTSGALGAELKMTAGMAEKFTCALPETVVHTELISKGKFQMGSPTDEPDHQEDETQHSVTLTKDFYMSKYTITNTQYAAFLNATGIGNDGKGYVTYYETDFVTSVTKNQTFVAFNTRGVTYDDNNSAWKSQTGYENHPVINVTWYGAKAYADWIGGKLPTEAQWEYACRAETTTAFSFGDDENEMGDYGWFWGNNDPSGTKPVGLKLPNAYNLYDMHGNVWEWCSDWYGPYPSSSDEDLPGPATGLNRVLRGGSWDNFAQYCRSAFRYLINPDYARSYIGFRVVFVP